MHQCQNIGRLFQWVRIYFYFHCALQLYWQDINNTSLTRYNAIILIISKRSSNLNIIPIYLSARLVACPQFRFLIFEYPTTKEAACNNKTNFEFILLYPRQQCDDDYPILTRGLLQRMQDTTKCRQQLLIDRRKIV